MLAATAIPDTWHVPPQLKGQIIERAYGFADGDLYERITDPSCGQVEIRLLGEASDDDAPWSEVPVARQALAEALGKFIQAGEGL